ncbi:MAG: HEAT repeat domain-containing protein [Planctomycetota bacterium]
MDPSEIPDTLPDDLDPSPTGLEPESPYRNLLVPLVVVPALIVMVLVLVYVLFGAVAGNERSPQENLDRILNGTSNERDQASMLLVSQVLQHLTAQQEGRDSEWEIDASFLPAVERAWEQTEEEDVLHRYVFAVIQAQLGDPAGLEHLIALLELRDDLDADGKVRFLTLRSLGALGPSLEPADQALAASHVARFLESDDGGHRLLAASALQTLPSDETVSRLRSALSDGRLDVRATAAISLSYHGDGEAGPVLREVAGLEAYDAERSLDPTMWQRSSDVSNSRTKAVEALARLGRPEDYEALERIALDDPDLNVRGAALKALDGR